MLETNNDERPGTGSAQTTDAALKSGGQAARTKRVLLVDDHNLFRELLGVVLEHRAGFAESVHAGSLDAARRALNGERGSEVDLAIVDLDLLGGDVFEFIEELRQAAPGLPVVAVTANHDPGLRARASEAGVGEVIAATASGEEIVAAAGRLGR